VTRGRTVLAFGLALAVLAGLAWMGDRAPSGSSALSRRPGGWIVARAYVEKRGGQVLLLDQPLAPDRPADVLVVSFPWQGAQLADMMAGGDGWWRRHLQGGGDLVAAYSGDDPRPEERRFFAGLGLPLEAVRERPPLHPLRWRRHVDEGWRLPPAGAAGDAPPLEVQAFRWAPAAPADASVLYRSPGGAALVFDRPMFRGTIHVLPAPALSNGRISAAGNAALLERLVRGRPSASWAFDEYHHGLLAAASPAATHSRRVIDLVLAHLAIAYLLALAAVARRFGPAWQEPPVITGSTASFFLSLGLLHHRLGHHAEAGRRLRARAQELFPGLALPAETSAEASTGDGFLRLAQRVAMDADGVRTR
jgi:hypothetical protein